MRIYLDVCCLNRPFDDQTQDRIRLETEAVLLILSRVATDEWQWVSSSVVTAEVKQTPDATRRQRLLLLLEQVDETIQMSPETIIRARELATLGFKPFDATHLAVAEYGRTDIFLTTDDRLMRLANRLDKQLQVRVLNPLNWIQELNV